jgi:hypothetical protein
VDGITVRFRNWVTLDPLHHRRVRRFDYEAAAENWEALGSAV